MKKALSTLLVLIFVISLCGCNEKIKDSSNPSSTVESTVDKDDDVFTIETKYFNLTAPLFWQENCHTEMTGGPGDDYYLEGEFEYVFSIYEKEAFKAFGGGNLFDIILTPNGDFNAFAHGEKIGEIIIENTKNYIFVRYPSDVQYNPETPDVYLSMSKDINEVIYSITPRNKKDKITLYNKEICIDEICLGLNPDQTIKKLESLGLSVQIPDYNECPIPDDAINAKEDGRIYNITDYSFYYNVKDYTLILTFSDQGELISISNWDKRLKLNNTKLGQTLSDVEKNLGEIYRENPEDYNLLQYKTNGGYFNVFYENDAVVGFSLSKYENINND